METGKSSGHPEQMQRREEVNINVHRERGEDLSREMISDEQVNSSLQFSGRHTFKFPGVISHNNQSPTAGRPAII